MMDAEQLRRTLTTITEAVKDKKCIWRLEGTANLLIQGVRTTTRDLDITTTEQGISIFREALRNHIIKDEYSEKIQGPSLICDIDGMEVEINAYGDRALNLFDKQTTTEWRGLIIPTLPLEYAKKCYERIGRKEKVKLIEDHLAKR